MILINKNFYKFFSLEFEPASQVLMKEAYNVLILPFTGTGTGTARSNAWKSSLRRIHNLSFSCFFFVALDLDLTIGQWSSKWFVWYSL